MYFKKTIICITSLFFMNSCAQNSKNDKKNNLKEEIKMEEEIIAYQDKMYDKIETFDKKPLYVLQVNKNNCRVLVSCNDIPHWITFFNNSGASTPLFLNDYITKSGKQLITIQIYPKEGQEFIADNADLDVKLHYAKHKDDGVDTYTNLAHVELPENIGSMKVPYFELKIPFEAIVPFDFSKDLELAQDLSKIPNIEEKVVAKYNQLRELLVNGDGLSFLKEIERSDLRTISYLYFTKKEMLDQNKEENLDIKRVRKDVKNRKVYPIENYEMTFSANNRLVILRRKKDKEEIINLEFETEMGIDGSIRCTILYMPKGSNELKVW
ncbi:hypothetical protein [Flavobacterium humidisoli]|uniref:Lipoprotein n=1 Tax=Flavobacterium humidisoli TaxID=2937442 RepID=A0ABY4LX91_9FLAO|nr:hypothetical protein [Flavobacterium humidisoli]UPZ16241.1 hypothetical protein M0M44_02570 [Flavobacterium humidisoli]